MRHTGTRDHIWTVEELPLRAGYRIYKSYNDAYSLKAWLSKNLTGFFEADNGEIMLPRKTQALINAKIKELTNGTASLNNLTRLPDEFKPLLPYLKYIQDINQTSVIKNFKKAWEKYGQGKILNQSEFEQYYTELRKIVYFLKANDTSGQPFPQEIFDSWVGLFGAVDPTGFPNIPTNALTKILGLTKKYRFEILPKYLLSKNVDADCRVNANYLIENNIY